MSFCFWTRVSVFVVANRRTIYVPAILLTSISLFAIVYPLRQQGQSTSGGAGQQFNASKVTHSSPCYNESEQVVIGLGTFLHHPSRHCLIFCVNEQTVALYNCQDSTSYWTRHEVFVWSNVSQLIAEFQDCSHKRYFFDLCRIPLVLSVLDVGQQQNGTHLLELRTTVIFARVFFQLQPEAEEALEKIYFEPSNAAAFTSNLVQLRDEANKLLPSHLALTTADVKAFRDSTPRIQITSQRKHKFLRVPFFAPTVDHCWASGAVFFLCPLDCSLAFSVQTARSCRSSEITAVNCRS